jgi:drug/metabolite transporter (DMT)-like permease
MPESKRGRLALIALLAGAVAIGFAPIFVRLSEVGSTATAFYRLLFALPVLWIWMTCEGKGESRRPESARDFGLLIAAGLLFAGDLAFWHGSINFTSVANATLLANFAPIFVTLGAWLLFRERITRRFALAMVLALVGATMLVGASLSLTPRHLVGDGMGMVTALFYAGYQLTVKRLRDSFSTATIMAWSGLVTCPALLVIAVISGESLLAVQATGWGVLIALALVSHVGGQSLIAYGFGHLPASLSSLSLLLQPVVAAFLAWLFFREQLSWLQFGGGAVVLGGIYLATRNPRPKPSLAPAAV